jgi:hypothetical protein
MMKDQAEWETGIDAQFLQRLEQRQHQPGVWDQRGALRLSARHTRGGIEHDLTARLNRRWQALDEEPTVTVPIVYATTVAPVVMSQQSGSTIQQTVINSQQVPLSEKTVVTPSRSKDMGSPSLPSTSAIVPQEKPFSAFAAAVDSRNRSLTYSETPKQVAGETAVPPPARIHVAPRPLRAAQASPVQPQSASRQDNNATPSPQSMASAHPLPLVSVQPLPAPTADTALPNKPMQPLSATQPARAESAPGNLVSTTPLPLVTAPPPAQTAVLPTNSPQQVSQPPSWMKKQVNPKGVPDIDINIDILANRVEKQLLQRLLIQRERRGKA